MSILELPPSAVRLLGASQAITGPVSVVKELIDNALDAGCQAIFVDLTGDALEIIQVRDDGCGIAPQDRPLLCKPHCTSKIRDFSDIKSVGGHSLGFRGEALARIAELSGCFTVTTRVGGEDAGTVLHFTQDGSIERYDKLRYPIFRSGVETHLPREDCASHPFGTTVRVANLFKHVPVRKATALKKSSETLAKIKRMMQAYAFARSKVRFSLKILKAKDSKGNWNYVPNIDGTMIHAALELIGSDCAKACSYTELETDGYLIQTLLPNAKAETSSINNMGQFISVDSRPVSSTRGVLKQVANACKDRLKYHVSGELKNPFLWVNIICPLESYDPNVEPAKDDVLFEDKEKLLAAVHALLAFRYSEPEKPLPGSSSENCHDTQVYLISEVSSAASAVDDLTARSMNRKRKFLASGMYSVDYNEPPASTGEENTDDVNLSDREEDTPCGLHDPKVSNPWVFAKLHSSTRNRAPLEVIEVPNKPTSILKTASERTVQPNWLPSLNSPATCFNKSPGTLTLHADQSNQSNQSNESDVQEVTASQGAENDLPTLPCGIRKARLFHGRTEEASPVIQDQMTTSLSVLEQPMEESRYATESSQSREQLLPGISREVPAGKAAHIKRARIPGQQKPFILPIKQETRNWFKNASIDSSPRKAGLAESAGVRQGVDIRRAFFNAPRFTPKQPIPKHQIEEHRSSNNGCSQTHLSRWLEQESHAADVSVPVSGPLCMQAKPLALEQAQGCGKAGGVVWSSSVRWFSSSSEKYANLDASLFDKVNEDAHEPRWGAAIEPPSRCSLISPPIECGEIEEWTDRVVQLMNSNNDLHPWDTCHGLRKADLKIASSVLVYVGER